MKKNIWIWNHYATNMFFSKGGRHLWFAKNLQQNGYNPAIFCSSMGHNLNNNTTIEDNLYKIDEVENIQFVFVKTTKYKGNGLSRIANMIAFYRNLFPVSKEYEKLNGRPDVILASSVHPLTLIAGIKIAKKYNVPCICEVRDLWPESIVEFGNLKKKSFIASILYIGEKWIYKKADRLIFTMEGASGYIKEKKWDSSSGGSVDLDKVYHINNGLDLKDYDSSIENNIFNDNDLNNPNVFKVVYAGSIRKANNLQILINAAKYVEEQNIKEIIFLIFGDGDEKEKLQKFCKKNLMMNVVFKGNVEKKYIPNILSKSNLNILNYSNHEIWKYGGSQNKIFEYLASGKPILSTITMGYDIIEKYKVGISLKDQKANTIGDAIILFANMDDDEYKQITANARKAAKEYDFTMLSKKLISIIESLN